MLELAKETIGVVNNYLYHAQRFFVSQIDSLARAFIGQTEDDPTESQIFFV